MTKSIRQLFLLAFMGCAVCAQAHDFTVSLKAGQKLFFTITSKTNRTAEVTYEGSIADRRSGDVSGDVVVPSTVEHDNVVYTITEIEAKAFANATKLTGIVLPSELTKIGAFAFEGCTSLKSIVFGSKTVTMGQGVFFKCGAIKTVSLGSDWKSVNLGMFRWSDSLTTVSIPAKVEKVQNMKMLKHLQSITVDANNAHFTAFGGALYSKDGKTLYGCPRALEGTLTVKDGTETVARGSLIDATAITAVEFPASLKSLSFRELSRMSGLQSVTFRGNAPLTTAYADGKGLFLLQVANKGVKINVPAESKKLFKAQLVQQAGEYKESNDAAAVPFTVSADELPDAKNIIGIKN